MKVVLVTHSVTTRDEAIARACQLPIYAKPTSRTELEQLCSELLQGVLTFR